MPGVTMAGKGQKSSPGLGTAPLVQKIREEEEKNEGEIEKRRGTRILLRSQRSGNPQWNRPGVEHFCGHRIGDKHFKTYAIGEGKMLAARKEGKNYLKKVKWPGEGNYP